MFGFAAELPVSASNLGDIDPTVLRADGTEAEGFVIRGVDGRVSRAVLEKRRGFLTVICARAGGRSSCRSSHTVRVRRTRERPCSNWSAERWGNSV